MNKIKNILIIALFSLVSVGLLPFNAGAASKFDTSLGFGLMDNSAVYNLQEFLISEGYLNYPPTGNYLSLTKTAVEAFQKDNNVSVTGYFGPLTRGVANKILALKENGNDVEKSNVGVVSVTNSTNAASAILSNSKIINWKTDQYPAQAGININLLRKVLSQPISYTLVRQIAKDIKNDGSEEWIPKSNEVGNDLYIEVTCSTSYTFNSVCSVSAPIKAY